MDKMSLIVFAKTGHVLGAFTRTAAPEAALEPAEVAGEGVWIRDVASGSRLLTVEPQHLKVETVDRRDAVLLAHRRFILVEGVTQEPPTMANVNSVTLSGTQLTITLGASPPEDVEAWVQVEGGPTGERAVVPVPILHTQNAVNATLSLSPGDYAILALVPGFRTFIGSDTVP